jgi:hypothetical protein
MRSQVQFQVLPWGFSLEGEHSHGNHGIGSLVELRFKAPPGTSYSYITIHLIGTASQLQKSVTLRPQPGQQTTKSARDMWWRERERERERGREREREREKLPFPQATETTDSPAHRHTVQGITS